MNDIAIRIICAFLVGVLGVLLLWFRNEYRSGGFWQRDCEEWQKKYVDLMERSLSYYNSIDHKLHK